MLRALIPVNTVETILHIVVWIRWLGVNASFNISLLTQMHLVINLCICTRSLAHKESLCTLTQLNMTTEKYLATHSGCISRFLSHSITQSHFTSYTLHTNRSAVFRQSRSSFTLSCVHVVGYVHSHTHTPMQTKSDSFPSAH